MPTSAAGIANPGRHQYYDIGITRLPPQMRLHRSPPGHRLAALAVSRWIEAQTGWSIRKFVKTARRFRTIEIQASSHLVTAADPIPDEFRHPLAKINNARPGAH
jgi:hypothetical protein